MLVELWVTIFQASRELQVKNFLTKMVRPCPKLGLVTVVCCVVSHCIVLKVHSAVADESANELYNCNYF